jgi:hypothetical protein
MQGNKGIHKGENEHPVHRVNDTTSSKEVSFFDTFIFQFKNNGEKKSPKKVAL